jgi:hypothetical protein
LLAMPMAAVCSTHFDGVMTKRFSPASVLNMLQSVRHFAAQKGFYIVRQGGKTRKMLAK